MLKTFKAILIVFFYAFFDIISKMFNIAKLIIIFKIIYIEFYVLAFRQYDNILELK